MLKYVNSQVVFAEFPTEVALAINLSLCPNKCKGCHSAYLTTDMGEILDREAIDELIERNQGITCLGFMGGDNDPQALFGLMTYAKEKYGLKIGWYSGRDEVCSFIYDSMQCDYMKIGHYDDQYGPLNSLTTNQKMLKLTMHGYQDITDVFQKKN